MPYEIIDDTPKGRYEVLDTPGKVSPLAGIMDKATAYSGRNALGGVLRGAGSIGTTIARPFESQSSNEQRRSELDQRIADLIGSNPEDMGYKTMKLGTEIAGTAGIGGAIAKGLKAIPWIANNAAPLLSAIESGGFTTGVTAKTLPAKAGELAVRGIGGGMAGGATAGLVNPEDAKTGALIGGTLPVAVKALGSAGRMVRDIKTPSTNSVLMDALDMPKQEVETMLAAVRNMPDEIIPGSKLTLSQALQLQGINQPGVKLLERIVAGGSGGDQLLKRYADQAAARLSALEKQGAQIYQGAPRQEAELTGSKIGAILRTQAKDDQQAVRDIWEKSVYPKAAQDEIALQLPIPQMQEALKGPFGPGSVIRPTSAQSVLDIANNVGYLKLPAINELPKQSVNSQTLEQAVRSAGGIRGNSGELRDLGIRQSGTTGMINNKSGQNADLLAEEMHRRGFIPDADPATLLNALRNGGGRRLFANDRVENNSLQRLSESAMGDVPDAEKVLQAVPFDQFQRLRRDAGALGRKLSEKTGSEAEAGVLGDFRKLLEQRVDEAASGNVLPGEVMTPGFRDLYNTARDMTRVNAERYKSGNNISSILRQPGGNYALSGDEVLNKVWHGGQGLAGDVANLKNVLKDENFNPTMDALRRYILTDAAGMTKASGTLGSGFPHYVESRMPGLLEALTPEQLQIISGVSKDIRNSDAAGAVSGLLGSDTQAKIDRALGAGLLNSSIAKAAGRLLSMKGVGAETIRSKMADVVIQHKGRALSELLANPKSAAAALADAGFVEKADSQVLKALRAVAARSPVLAAQDSP